MSVQVCELYTHTIEVFFIPIFLVVYLDALCYPLIYVVYVLSNKYGDVVHTVSDLELT